MPKYKDIEAELARMRELEESIKRQLAELREMTDRARLILDDKTPHAEG